MRKALPANLRGVSWVVLNSKLGSVDERIEYCRVSQCCTVCDIADMSSVELSEGKHKRCDYKQPVDRFLTKCTAYRFTKPYPGRKISCCFGAALCSEHKAISTIGS